MENAVSHRCDARSQDWERLAPLGGPVSIPVVA